MHNLRFVIPFTLFVPARCGSVARLRVTAAPLRKLLRRANSLSRKTLPPESSGMERRVRWSLRRPLAGAESPASRLSAYGILSRRFWRSILPGTWHAESGGKNFRYSVLSDDTVTVFDCWLDRFPSHLLTAIH